MLLLTDYIYLNTTDKVKFREIEGKGSRAAAGFEDIEQSTWIIVKFRENESHEYLLTNCESRTLLNNLNTYSIWYTFQNLMWGSQLQKLRICKISPQNIVVPQPPSVKAGVWIQSFWPRALSTSTIITPGQWVMHSRCFISVFWV